MGYWGYAPWQNDESANWFAEVFEKTQIAQIIDQALRQELSATNFAEVRAAISLFILLGHVHVYDSDFYEEHVRLSLSRNRELLYFIANATAEDPSELKIWLEHEKTLLERRALARSKREAIPASLSEWWDKWID